MWHDGMSSGAMGWFMLILLVLVALLAVAVIRAVQRPDRPQPPGPRVDPEDLLAERLARGEIDDAEFRRVLDLLRTIGR